MRSHSSTSRRLFSAHLVGLGRESGDQIGAEHGVGPAAPDVGANAQRIGAAVAALHALQDHVVAGLQAEMQMRHQPRLGLDQSQEVVVDLDGIERGQPQTAQFGHLRQQAADHLAEDGPARQIGAIGGDVDAGQHDLGDAASTSARTWRTTSPMGTLRLGPRPKGMMQKVQR